MDLQITCSPVLIDFLTAWLITPVILLAAVVATMWAIRRAFRFHWFETMEVVLAGLLFGELEKLSGVLPCGVIGVLSLPGILFAKAVGLGSQSPVTVAMMANFVVYSFVIAVFFRWITGASARRCVACGARLKCDDACCRQCGAERSG